VTAIAAPVDAGRARATGLALLVLPPLFWAGNFIVGRAMRGQLPPFTMSFLRWAIALGVLLPFAWRRMRRDAAFYRGNPGQVFALSLTGVVAFNSFVYVGLRSTSAANGLLLNSTIPLLIMLIGAIAYRQILCARQLAGVAVSLCGVVTIVLGGDPARLATLAFAPGDAIVFCGMVAWAVYTLKLRAVPPAIDRVGLLGVQIVIAMPVLALMGAAELAAGARPVWSGGSIAALAYIGIFPSVLAYLAYNMAVARVGPATAGLSIHLLPMFGVVLAALLLGEPLHAYHLAGFALILGGLALASVTRLAAAPVPADLESGRPHPSL
jgi:drug/metabolite transporter (DMT)-like permease